MTTEARPRRRRGVRVAMGIATPLVLLLALGQAILPSIAAHHIRDQLRPYGGAQSASVSAWPAVELLWGKADSASAHARSLRLPLSQAIKLLWEARGVHSLHMTTTRLDLSTSALPGGLALQDAVMSKQGDHVDMQGVLTPADLSAALPAGFQVQPLQGTESGLEVRASGPLLGGRASIVALVTASEGKLVVQPQNIPFGGLAQLTLISEPHLYVEAVTAAPQPGQSSSWRIAMAGILR